jgi:uncharacterized protein (TIGR00725 family)
MTSPPEPPARPLHIAVIGGYRADDAVVALAEDVGRLLAEAGAVVVTGGREGVAAAASRGAAAAGGLTIGILPGRDRAEANPWVVAAVATGMGETRNALVVMNGDAVIAFDGAFGTLSELAHARNDGLTVIALGDWSVSPLRGSEALAEVTNVAASPAEAVALALAAAGRRLGRSEA